MNSCPNCRFAEFSFGQLRRSSVRKPIHCRKCGEMIAKYNVSQPLLYSVAITAGSFAIIPILLWNAYSVVAILFTVLGLLFFSEYLEASRVRLRRKSDLSAKKQFLLSFVIVLLGITASLGVVVLSVNYF